MARLAELIVVRQRYTPYGGAERFIARLLEQLATDGVDVRILCREWDGESPFEVTRLRVRALTRGGRDKAFARQACAYVNAHPGSIVQSHERLACCDIFRAGDGVHREWLNQRARRRPAWRRALDRLSPFHRGLLDAERRMYASPRLRAVICNSAMVRREIIEHFGVAAEKLHVIHNGVDTGRFHPRLRDAHREGMRAAHGFDGDRPLFLFVGSGFERKGLDVTLSALASANPAIQLAVIGRDSRQRRYEKLAQRLGLSSRVVFLGPRRDVEHWYGAADAVVLPTLYDPFPNVVIEAMACGLPVITSTKSGATDIIGDGENGLVCDALDETALIAHLDRLADPESATRIGRAARLTAEGLDIARMTRQYTELYQGIFNYRR